MGEDARLDDFLTDASADSPDAPDPESTDAAGETAGADASDTPGEDASDTPGEDANETPAEEASDDSEHGSGESLEDGTADAIVGVEPTTRWRPGGGQCERCGSDARRLWNDEGTQVCADCATWRR